MNGGSDAAVPLSGEDSGSGRAGRHVGHPEGPMHARFRRLPLVWAAGMVVALMAPGGGAAAAPWGGIGPPRPGAPEPGGIGPPRPGAPEPGGIMPPGMAGPAGIR